MDRWLAEVDSGWLTPSNRLEDTGERPCPETASDRSPTLGKRRDGRTPWARSLVGVRKGRKLCKIPLFARGSSRIKSTDYTHDRCSFGEKEKGCPSITHSGSGQGCKQSSAKLSNEVDDGDVEDLKVGTQISSRSLDMGDQSLVAVRVS